MNVVVMKHTPAITKLAISADQTVRAIMGDGQIGFAGLEVEVCTNRSLFVLPQQL